MKKTSMTKANRMAFLLRLAVVVLVVLSSLGVVTYAWYTVRAGLTNYAPVFSPEALYIGAAHRDLDSDTFEDARYLYFSGMDAEGADYVDKVFCVYGKGIGAYKIQLAYTTNNPFTYVLYHANESETNDSPGAVEHIVHHEAKAYYYSASGEAIAGSFLNRTIEGGVGIATDAKHEETYGSYDEVQKNAEPIYWQTSSSETGNSRGGFVNYYLLRIYKNGKATNDRETDVLCIAAKAITLHE